MPSRVECPACELRFEVADPHQDGPFECPECGATFKGEVFTEDESAEPKTPPVAPAVPPPPPVPKALKRAAPAKPSDHEAPDPRQQSAPPEPPTAIPVARPANVQRKTIPVATAVAPKPPPVRRSKTSYAPIYIGLMFLCMAGCLGIATVLIHNHFTSDTSSNEPLVINEEATTSDGKGEVSRDPTMIDLAEPENRFTAEQHQALTRNLAPYIVQVNAQHDSGAVLTAGLLIDSRGWIVTSYEAVKGASRVEVQLGSSRAKRAGTDSVTVKSLGTLFENPSHNVSVIAIDTNEIADERDVSLSIDDFPAEAQELAMVGWSDGAATWFTDCTVESLGPEPDPDSRPEDVGVARLALVSHGLRPDQAGAFVSRIDGAIAGMFYDTTARGRGIILPVRYLREATRQVSDAPRPFAGPGAVESAVVAPATDIASTDPGLKNDDPNRENPATVPTPGTLPGSTDPGTSGPARSEGGIVEPGSIASIDRIQELFELCQRMHWTPQSSDQYVVFQELAQFLAAADGLVDRKDIDPGQVLLVTNAAKSVRDELAKRLPWPGEPQMKQLNGLAVASLVDDREGFFGYGEVVLIPGISPEVDETGTAVLRLIGTSQLIILPIKMNHALFKLNSKWVVIGVDTSRGVAVSDNGTPLGRAAMVTAKYIIERRQPLVSTATD